MDDGIAVRVTLEDGAERYFLTWGRIQHAVDPEPVCALVLKWAGQFGLGGRPVSAQLCGTLREAADSGSAPYFFECLLELARRPAADDPGYPQWRASIAAEMEQGRAIYYCGRPVAPG
ncbi:hypothetical protein AB0M46_45045 [Dactylosporangium sp. NPDC051485]|uniref:hypothetical protein n=1 Tax=Dactylosporangium sp. NPDC051485 TaxID=3154846 RepID=UPI003447FAD1